MEEWKEYYGYKISNKGRILNRFSKDIGHMDDLLPLIFQDFMQVT